MLSPHAGFPALRDVITQTIILAHKEDTTQLEQALRKEAFAPQVLRPTYTKQELAYSRTIRCLLNHNSAWTLAREAAGFTLVMEADFVPCVGFGALPLPFEPSACGGTAWAFLYAGGPRFFHTRSDGSLPGHSACPVAYVISPCVGGWLTDYTREEFIRNPDLTQYSLWDTQFQWHLMGKGATCFMPWRQYGEHGGLSNPEHQSAGIGVAKRIRWLGRFGLGRNHHADVLYAPLQFLPLYAQGSHQRFRRTRFEAKLTGLLKLFSNRMAKPLQPLPFRERIRLYRTCLFRLCGPY
jgi:hypothetical protein